LENDFGVELEIGKDLKERRRIGNITLTVSHNSPYISSSTFYYFQESNTTFYYNDTESRSIIIFSDLTKPMDAYT